MLSSAISALLAQICVKVRPFPASPLEFIPFPLLMIIDGSVVLSPVSCTGLHMSAICAKIAYSIRESGYFALEADEVTDVSNKEQLVVCLRWVDSKFEPHEDFIGLYHVDDITAETIVTVLKDTVLRINWNLSMCRGQCYDGASNMKKVAHDIKAIEPKVLYLHCYGPSLNLAAADTLKEVKPMANTLDHALEMSNY